MGPGGHSTRQGWQPRQLCAGPAEQMDLLSNQAGLGTLLCT